MSSTPRWRRYLRFLGPDPEADLEDEISYHLAKRTEEYVARGMSEPEARRAAERRMGDLQRVREECGAIGRRRQRRRDRRVRLAALRQDLAYALRLIRKSPGFTLAAVLTLAVGIGATSGIFSVVNGVLIRPPPYPDADELVVVWSRYEPSSGYDFPQFPVALPEYLDLEREFDALARVAAVGGGSSVTLSGDGAEAARVPSNSMTPNFFSVLGVELARGRTFREEETELSGPDVVILSHATWRSRFGGDPEIVGRTVILDDSPHEVIGVAPEALDVPSPDLGLMLPLRWRHGVEYPRSSHQLWLVGRLAPDRSLAGARTELSGLMTSWRERFPDHFRGHYLFLRPLGEERSGEYRSGLLLLLGAVGLVLLIACANVANLLMARGESRRHEFAVRAALGARRWRLVRQVLTESLVLALVGGALGAALAAVGVPALLSLYPGALPATASVDLDLTVLGFIAAVSMASAALFGVLPAFQSSFVEAREELAQDGRGRTPGGMRRRFGQGLVIAEVALGVLLVAGAGLLMKSFSSLQSVDLGFEPPGVLTARAYPRGDSASQHLAFWNEVRQRVEALPGVEGVGATTGLPFAGPFPANAFVVEGKPLPGEGEPSWVGRVSAVSPGYFETMRIRLLEGRRFAPTDGRGGPLVTIVSRALSDRFFPGEDVIGKRLRGAALSESPWLTIVGVVDDVRIENVREPARPAWYIPHAQVFATYPWLGRGMALALRTAEEPAALAGALRRVVREVDRGVPLSDVQPMGAIVSDATAPARFTASIMAVFAGVAAGLAAVGIYAVMAYSVARRRRELALRVALGAVPGSILGLVLRQGAALAVVGLAIGLLGALAGGRLIRSLLFDVSPTDPWVLAAVTLVMGAVAVAACAVPARRATRVDPMTAFRTE